MRNGDKPSIEYSHQLYKKAIPTHAELSELAERGSLADMLKFKRDKADQLKEEARKVANIESNHSRNVEAGRLNPEYVKPTNKKKAFSPPAELSAIFGYGANRAPISVNDPKQKVVREPQLSRKLADPYINDPVLNSIRVQSWYLALLSNWFPDEAMAFRDHMLFNLIASVADQVDLAEIESARALLPALPPDGNGGVMLEKKLREGLRHNPRLNKKRYNLKVRNYVFGKSTPSEDTVTEFGLVCVDSENVYRLGFDGLPMWQVLDGDLQTCHDFASKFLSQDLIESPNQYAQFVLNVLHGLATTDVSDDLVCPFDSDSDVVLSFLEGTFSKLSSSEIYIGESNDLSDQGMAIARGILLLIALIRINPPIFVESTARLHLLFIMLRKHKLLRNAFGLFVEFYIVRYMH